ncbi:Putative AAA+ ATPase domain, ATPase, AAA-type, core, AAA ATPase, AAA+ lid domain-containing protein [Septoria linicola]|uniref:AAA+ ATPase domain, ATPase, AAA-type, core, AAA ATPase, AAA+ lid domain-containing protein n=1 Tax=Septoria linicola TaxID=215465 RepID=A0A9Q9ELE4_9PEZI|nr:Putative AAA+ ATPase domain, ATPase, AAA-type, core, AAA ATPase, AAA+ lid domain-containing protein [Septoria linicola]
MSTSTSTTKGETASTTTKAGKMDASHVVVRLQQSKGLQDAFRVHILPESLTDAGLKLNDLCQITSEDGMTTGYGIAWRAEDKMGSRPKVRPAKMTETFRDLYDFKDGSKVKISRTDMKIFPADKIVLYDVTPEGHNKPDAVDEVTHWESRIRSLFEDSDAIAAGISFEVTGAKKYRRRFHVESIESATSLDTNCLHSVHRETTIVLPSGVTTRPPTANGTGRAAQSNGRNGSTNARNGSISLEIDIHRIGGLLEQAQQLNELMKDLLDTTCTLGRDLCPPILLHGYEGCGKTTMLETLAGCGFRNVYHIESESLLSTTLAKGRTQIQEIFQEALAHEPSLIVMDNLHAIASAEDDKFSSTIIRELAKIRGHSVMAVAATRSPSDVKKPLIGMRGFWKHIEITIPDAPARQQILNVLRGKPVFAKDDVAAALSARTHGFTGENLDNLHEEGVIHAKHRLRQERLDRESARSPSLPTYNEANGFSDSQAPNSASVSEVELQDYEHALTLVVPTALREIFTEKPKVQWSDIGGSDRVRESFDDIIGLRQYDKDLLLEFKREPEKGVLLYGPPGCSKTLTAQAVANSYNFNFIAIKGAELISKYVGDSEKRVREVFQKAKAAAPCVIFFDEIDSIGGSRDQDGTKGLNVLTTLLNEMDGFEALKDVLILAATNKPESLDSALMRPGRFDSHVYLGPPNVAARQDIFRIACEGITLADDVKYALLAGKTDGYSGAEIVRICNVAKSIAIKRARSDEAGARQITMADFDSARAEVKKGITKEMLEAYASFARGEA